MEIVIANAEALARTGEYQPKVAVGGGAGLERVGRWTSQGASDASDEIAPGRFVPEVLADQLGFFASWEVDIWGRLRDATKAAVLRTSRPPSRNSDYVITRLVAELAHSYYELLALDNQLLVLNRNIEIQNQALEVVRTRRSPRE